MQHFHTIEEVNLEDVWLTIGSFDGVHRGHQSIIQELIKKARENNGNSVVLTFYPHPAAILRGRNFPFYLSSPDEKAHILEKLGVDVLITHPFNREIANQTAQSFIRNLKKYLKFQHLQVGYDFVLGKNRGGDVGTIQKLSEGFNFSIEQNPPVLEGGDPISSSRIRFLIGAGQVEEASHLIGRPYRVEAIVEIGDQRGQTLGFPTANMAVWNEKIIPSAGVYACWVNVRGKTWGAVTNVGVRPTFEEKPVPPRVETHILDFEDEIYGEMIQLDFVSRLRNEVRFKSVDELVKQIHNDTIQARVTLYQG